MKTTKPANFCALLTRIIRTEDSQLLTDEELYAIIDWHLFCDCKCSRRKCGKFRFYVVKQAKLTLKDSCIQEAYSRYREQIIALARAKLEGIPVFPEPEGGSIFCDELRTILRGEGAQYLTDEEIYLFIDWHRKGDYIPHFPDRYNPPKPRCRICGEFDYVGRDSTMSDVAPEWIWFVDSGYQRKELVLKVTVLFESLP